MLTQAKDIFITPGLAGQDEIINDLFDLWDGLKYSSPESTQTNHPTLFQFVDNAFFFATIFKNSKEEPKEKQSTNPFTSLNPFDTIADDWPPPNQSSTSRAKKVVQVGFEPDFTSYSPPSTSQAYETSEYNTRKIQFEIPPVIPPVEGEEEGGQTSGPIGFVYLTLTASLNAPVGEANIGVILSQEAEGCEFARQAVELVLQWVFEEVKFHRVQAVILGATMDQNALTLYTQLGFRHEGTRRRAIYDSLTQTWVDATYLAMLDTEWMMRSYLKPAPKSLWDELFFRHSREREDLLRWEDEQTGLKRSTSTETIRILREQDHICEPYDCSDQSDVCELDSDDEDPTGGKGRETRSFNSPMSSPCSWSSFELEVDNEPPHSSSPEDSDSQWDILGSDIESASGS